MNIKKLISVLAAGIMTVSAIPVISASAATQTSIAKCKIKCPPLNNVTYTGSAQKPAITVTTSAGKTLSSSNYTVSYKNNINVGVAKITVTGKGKYTGSISTQFIIQSKTNSLTKLTASSTGQIIAEYTKGSPGITGYQVLYSNNLTNLKSATCQNLSKGVHSQSLTGLQATLKNGITPGETWYVKVRPYFKKPASNQRYGQYSSIMSVKIPTTAAGIYNSDQIVTPTSIENHTTCINQRAAVTKYANSAWLNGYDKLHPQKSIVAYYGCGPTSLAVLLNSEKGRKTCKDEILKAGYNYGLYIPGTSYAYCGAYGQGGMYINQLYTLANKYYPATLEKPTKKALAEKLKELIKDGHRIIVGHHQYSTSYSHYSQFEHYFVVYGYYYKNNVLYFQISDPNHGQRYDWTADYLANCYASTWNSVQGLVYFK